MTWRAACAALVMSAACAGGELAPDAGAGQDDTCAPASGEGVSFDPDAPLCTKLSSYRFFTAPGAAMAPNQGVVPYELNTPLFSDYTVKDRFVYLPAGAAMVYHDQDPFDMPVGTALLKTFAYPEDLRDPLGPRRLLETRLLYRSSAGWDAITYVWNDEQTEAYREIAGATVHARWIHHDGAERTLAYSVPNKNECKACHQERDDTLGPVGPRARHLHRVVDHGQGPASQLQHLAERGYLTGLPANLEDVPRAPVWDDEGSGTLEARARTWLDINCAHCHNPRGAARTSGLDLGPGDQTPYGYGVCKTPVAAGSGSGGLRYNIVPGQPDASILVFRLASTRPDVRMPELGRQLVDEEGLALIRAWIEDMEGDCGGPENGEPE